MFHLKKNTFPSWHTMHTSILFIYFCIQQESSFLCTALFCTGEYYDVAYSETGQTGTHFASLLCLKFLLIFMVSCQETPKSGSLSWDVLNTEGMWWWTLRLKEKLYIKSKCSLLPFFSYHGTVSIMYCLQHDITRQFQLVLVTRDI